MSKPLKPPTPVILRENCIVNGVFIRAGEVTPYEREEDLPESLKGLVADGSEEPYSPADRDIYRPELRREATTVLGNVYIRSLPKLLWRVKINCRQKRRQLWQTRMRLHIAKVKAQLLVDQHFVEAAELRAAGEAEAKTPKFHVKRGAIFVSVEKAKLVPAEPVLVQRPNKEWECVGYVDAAGGLPDEEIHI